MAKILMDVNGWQSLMDFKTGDELELKDYPSLAPLAKISADHPYPGDLKTESIAWMTDSALAIHEYYDPDFMFMTFAIPDFMRVNVEMTPEEDKELNDTVFGEVKRFLDATGYEPIIIGTGALKQVREFIETSHFDGLVSSGVESCHKAGVFDMTPEDEERIKALPHITKVMTKAEFRAAFPGMNDMHDAYLPDRLIFCEDDCSLTSIAGRGFRPKRLPHLYRTLPVYTDKLPAPESIWDVYGIVMDALDQDRRVALIVLEAMGPEDFPMPVKEMNVVEDGFVYELDFNFYRVLNTGRRFWDDCMFPSFMHRRHFDKTDMSYPFSYVFNGIVPKTIGSRPDKRTASVGTRSGWTHSNTLADISFECHSRNLAESGVLMYIGDKVE